MLLEGSSPSCRGAAWVVWPERGVMVGLASPHPGRDTSPCYLPVTGQNQPSRASQTASLRGAPSGYTGEGDTVFPELNRSGRDVGVPS